MAENLLELSDAEIAGQIEPILAEFLIKGSDYPAISEASARLVDKSMPQALYTPAVKFMVDATLQIVNRPEAAASLPREVYQRQAVASSLGMRVAAIGIEQGAFMDYYRADQSLTLTKSALLSLNDPDYLGRLGSAQFADVRTTAGGALKLLRMAKLDEESTAIIKRSHDLLAISGVHKDNTKMAEALLGQPYADVQHFRGRRDNVGHLQELIFEPSTKQLLRALYKRGGGCPAGRIALEGVGGQTVLAQYWAKIVDFLIPDNATINGFEELP